MVTYNRHDVHVLVAAKAVSDSVLTRSNIPYIRDVIDNELWKFMTDEIVKFSQSNGNIQIVKSTMSRNRNPSQYATDYILEVEIIKEPYAQNNRPNQTTIRLR